MIKSSLSPFFPNRDWQGGAMSEYILSKANHEKHNKWALSPIVPKSVRL